MTLTVNSLLCRQNYACYDQTAEAGITRFSLQSNTLYTFIHHTGSKTIRCNNRQELGQIYTIEYLYLSYLHIQLDYTKLKGISSNFKHNFRLACVQS